MFRWLVPFAAVLLLSACTSFEPGLVEPSAPIERSDKNLEGVWQFDDGKQVVFLKVTPLPSWLMEVKVAEKGRCKRADTFTGRLVTMAGRRYVQLWHEGEKSALLGAYEWTSETEVQIFATDDEVFAKAVDQQQLFGTHQARDKSHRTLVQASPLVLQDFIKKHPEAMKPLGVLRRASDFPC